MAPRPFKLLFMVIPFVLGTLAPVGLAAQNIDEGKVIAAINGKLLPLKSLSPTDDISDLKPLKAILKDKPVVGLGESAHGVHEFFTVKTRLLEYLVKELGYKILLTETDAAGTKVMNDYVTTGKGDAYKGMAAMGNSVWSAQEFIEMAEWVKKYNDTQADKDKVHIYGFDNTSARRSVPLLTTYLTDTKQLTPEIQAGLTAIIKPAGQLTAADKTSIKNLFVLLKNIKFDEPNEQDGKFYSHLPALLEQYYEYALPTGAAYANQKNDIRDKNMADNVEWAYNYANYAKAVIWSHSEHLTKVPNSSGIKRMGYHLANTFKDKLYVLGGCFYSGRIRSADSQKGGQGDFDVPPPVMNNNSDILLAGARTPNFILDFKTASKNSVIKDYLNQMVTSYFIGSNYASKAGTDQMFVQHKWAEGFDGILFIKTVNPATAVKQP